MKISLEFAKQDLCSLLRTIILLELLLRKFNDSYWNMRKIGSFLILMNQTSTLYRICRMLYYFMKISILGFIDSSLLMSSRLPMNRIVFRNEKSIARSLKIIYFFAWSIVWVENWLFSWNWCNNIEDLYLFRNRMLSKWQQQKANGKFGAHDK